ncbi:MAG: hypothetical protein ACREMD_15165 [Gemmatimonadota bacterium]
MSRAPIVLAAALAVLLPAVPLHAQEALELNGYGVRAGVSLDDDLTQFLLGGHLDLGRPWERVRIQTPLVLGLGDDAISFLVGGEAHYLFAVDPTESRVDPYVGGGLGLLHVNRDEDAGDDDDTEVALILLGGIDVPMRTWWKYFVEGKFLLADNSIFRLEGGVTWTY